MPGATTLDPSCSFGEDGARLSLLQGSLLLMEAGDTEKGRGVGER